MQMWAVKRIIAVALLLVLGLGRANAFWVDGTCTALTSASASSYTLTLPGGSQNTNDALILIVESLKSGDITTSTSGWTSFAITGGDGSNNVSWESSSSNTGEIAVFWALQGASAPTIAVASNSNRIGYVLCAVYGALKTGPIDQVKVTASNASSATVTFPSLTPAGPNEEYWLNAVGASASSPTITPGTSTTCSTTTSEVSEATINANAPDNFLYEQNQGPCSATATSAGTSTLSAAEYNAGISLLLKSAAFAPQRHYTGGANIRNSVGDYYLINVPNAATPWDVTMNEPWVDGETIQGNWDNLEDTACDTFSWDEVDNEILNARLAGINISLMFGSGSSQACGVANTPASCSGITLSNISPPWLNGSTTCSNSTTPATIDSIWTKTTRGLPVGSNFYVYDPGNSAYQHAYDRWMSQMGSRYGSISNITAVTAVGIATTGIEANIGQPDGTVVTVSNATALQAEGITGDSDWASGHSGYTTSTKIIPSANNSGAYVYTPTASCTSGSTEPNPWNQTASGTSNDNGGSGGCTWTNEGQATRTVADKAQWTSLGYNTTTGTCTGSDGTLCSDLLNAQKHFEGDVASDFSNAVISAPITQGAPLNTSYPTGGTSAAYVSAIYAYEAATYAGKIGDQNNAMGQGSNGQIFTASNAGLVKQPAVQVRFQEFSAQYNTGGTGTDACNQSPGPPNSISSANCVPPTIYAVLAASQFPYLEVYLQDMDSAASQPWLVLLHQIANRQ
jgi:hypothetical protein